MCMMQQRRERDEKGLWLVTSLHVTEKAGMFTTYEQCKALLMDFAVRF